MTSSSSSSTIGENMHQFVDRVLVRMEKDELASLLDIALDYLDEGKELAISHAKLTEFANEGMLQPCVGSSELSNKNEMNHYLETTNDRVVSSDECCTNTSIHPVSDSQTFNSVKCIKASEDNQMSDVMSDQSDCTEPSILKIKRCGRRRNSTSNMISSDSCESETVSKQLQHSKRNKKCNSSLEKFVFPVIRESRRRKFDSTISLENKSQPEMLKSSSVSDNSETKIPSFDRQQQISTKNKGEKTVKYKNTETSNVRRVSTKEINGENMPLSQRLRRGTKASLRLSLHVNKSNSSTKHKTSVYLNAKQNKNKLNKSSSENFEVPIEKPAEDLLDGTEQNRTHSTSDMQKLLSLSKVKKNTSHTSPLKLHSIEKNDTKVKSKHERVAQSPSNGNKLQNVLIAQKNSEENLHTGTKTRKKRCENKSQKLSCSKNDNLKSDCVETISEPILLGLESSESDINDSSNFKQDEILKPKRRNTNQQKKQDENIQDIRSPFLTDGISSTSEKQEIISKTSQMADSYEMQNKDGKINKVPDTSALLATINITNDSVLVSDIGQVASIEWLSTNDDDDTGKESSIEDDTPAELELFDSDCIQVCSISENEYSISSYGPQKLSSSLECDSTEKLLSKDQEKDADKSDEETCSSDKYAKLKEQFQRAGLDLDIVAQSIDEQRLKEVIHKAGKDSGMLLRLPHFCPCSNKQVGQCLIIINSLKQYIKEKNKRLSLTD